MARIGGDEFAILMKGTVEEIERAADRLIEAVRQPLWFDGELLTATISVGIAQRFPEERDPDELMKRADIALYRAKAAGRDRHCLFQPEYRVAVEEHARTMRDIRRGDPPGRD